MSPPIRDGSGNDIGSIRLGDGSEIAEVRTGAGDVLFSASGVPQQGLLHDWKASNFDGSTWANAVAAVDLSVSSGSPTLQSNGINGEPAVSFDPSTADELNATGINVSTPYVVFAVVDLTDDGTIHALYSDPDGSGEPKARYRFDAGDSYLIESGGATIEVGPIQAGQQIDSIEYNGSNSEVRVDDSTVGTGTLNSDTLGDILVGELTGVNGQNLNGLLARLLIYDRSQMSSGQVSDVNNSLNNIYGVF